jgi:hypothetical protein
MSSTPNSWLTFWWVTVAPKSFLQMMCYLSLYWKAWMPSRVREQFLTHHKLQYRFSLLTLLCFTTNVVTWLREMHELVMRFWQSDSFSSPRVCVCVYVWRSLRQLLNFAAMEMIYLSWSHVRPLWRVCFKLHCFVTSHSRTELSSHCAGDIQADWEVTWHF